MRGPSTVRQSLLAALTGAAIVAALGLASQAIAALSGEVPRPAIASVGGPGAIAAPTATPVEGPTPPSPPNPGPGPDPDAPQPPPPPPPPPQTPPAKPPTQPPPPPPPPSPPPAEKPPVAEGAKPAPKADAAARSEAVVDGLVKGAYDEVFAQFDATMKGAISKDQLKSLWEQLQSQVGAYKSHGKAEVTTLAGYLVGVVPIVFENANLNAEIAWNEKWEIAGLHFRPPAPKASYSPPAYVQPSAFTEQAVTAGSPGWPLPATMSVPAGEGPFPAAVLVHGSGPNDRDESVGGVKVFRDLAGGLASRGVAVLRYEKRTKEHGSRIVNDPDHNTLDDEVVDDALAAVAQLRRTPRIDPARVFVIGHSLGGMMVPEIARRDGSLAGIVSMAGPTRPLEDMMREQTVYLLAQPGVSDAVRAAKMAELDAELAKVHDMKPGATGGPVLGAPPSYWASLHAYHPLDVAKTIKVPFFILQGERDYQVTMKDYERWRSALGKRRKVETRSYPKLNHLFVAGEGPSYPSEYEQPGHVSTLVIEDLSAWIEHQAPARL